MRIADGLLLLAASLTGGCSGQPAPPAPPPKAPAPRPPAGWVSPDPNQDAPPPRPEPEPPPPAAPRNGRSPLGMNVRFLDYHSSSGPFLNLLRMGQPWISRTTEVWDDKRPLEQTEQGIIKKLAKGQWAATLIPTVTGGRMVLRWEGTGSFSLDGKVKVLASTAGRILFDAPPGTEIVINLTATDPKDPARNIEVVPQALEAKSDEERFHPLFLERLGQFSVIRFLEWSRINGSHLARWEDRAKPGYLFQSTDAGVAYEHQIALVNQLQADIWICVPHQANDDFVRELAGLLQEKLAPERRVYLEWSNEVWNEAAPFTQSSYARTKGLEEKLADDPTRARLRYQAKRSVEVFRIFEEVFGGPDRLVEVIASQTGDLASHRELLNAPGVRKHADALAVAPYFGQEVGATKREGWLVRTSPELILDHLENVSLPETIEAVRASAKLAKRNGLDLLAYEGGQHLVASPAIRSNPAVNAKLDAVNRHPRMKALTLRLLRGWREAGGKTFVYYAFAARPNQWGRFGALDYLDQPIDEAVKYDALVQFIEANPRWW